jgi:glutathione S-transferase
MLTIEVPDEYPWVLLSATVLPIVTSTIMGGLVMKARTTYKVPYPNLYAVPGVHEKADAFNRVQRGHQNMFETLPSIIAMTVVGGLR